ncbi:MAG: DUF222 domain-containing protein [Acidimicrobiia bacterium]
MFGICEEAPIGTELPGPESWADLHAALLSFATFSVDRRELSDAEAVLLLQARQRLVNHLMAERSADIVEVCRRTGAMDEPGEFDALEVACALTLTRRKSEAEVDLAFGLERLPNVFGALYAGEIDWLRARIIVEGLEHLDDATAAELAAVVLEDAPSLTTGKLAALIRRLCLAHDPDGAADRYRRSVEDRSVAAIANHDGTGFLHADRLPADRLHAAMGHIDALARRLGDDRTMEQKRVDVMLDLLSGRCHHLRSDGATGRVDVTVDLETLIGLADRPAEIPGWGPTIAEIARKALEADDSGRLRVKVHDADASVEVTARTPSAAQRRAVHHRRPRCCFPGCRMPARRSDLDHRVPHAVGGPTRVDNLVPLCRFHHRGRHGGRWSYVIDPDGTIVWTSPLGRTYPVDPRGP